MPEQISPSPYPHWMLREIHEQPMTLAATLARYVEDGSFNDQACAPLRQWAASLISDIVIAASGSSRHAGLVAELTIEEISGFHVDVEYASEYTYRMERALKGAAVMVVSQSGETADTLAALRKANAAGRQTLAVTNVANSSMTRDATAAFTIEAGRERAIPATKSFTGQLMNLYLLSLLLAETRKVIEPAELKQKLQEVATLPAKIAAQLEGWEEAVRVIAKEYGSARSFLFLGRGVHYAIAREGALKLKESAYMHAEGYPSGELKHGPNAIVGEDTPLVMIITVDRSRQDSVERYEKNLQLLQDMRTQGAKILAIANTGDEAVAALASHTIYVEELAEDLLPIEEVIPLQLFAYFMAINAGIDVDRPRNLTKAVLSE